VSSIDGLDPHFTKEERATLQNPPEKFPLVGDSHQSHLHCLTNRDDHIVSPRDSISNYHHLPPQSATTTNCASNLISKYSLSPITNLYSRLYSVTQDSQPKFLKNVDGRLRLVDANGNSLVKSAIHNSRMEHFDSPQFGSVGSTLSPTQENDPTIIEQKVRESMIRYNESQSSQLTRPTIQLETDPADSGKSALHTEQSYATGDQGYIGLDLDTSQGHNLESPVDFKKSHLSQLRYGSNFDSAEAASPETPAPPKNPFARTGDILAPSEMFGFTQVTPAPASNIYSIAPSSSRPSPDIFHNGGAINHEASSPIHQHISLPSSPNVRPYISSSPPASSCLPTQVNKDQNRDLPPISVSSDIVEGPLRSSSFHRQALGPIETYRSRRESQERREQQNPVNNKENHSSDDDFETDIQRHFRRKRAQDARMKGLEKFSASFRAPAIAGDDIEVPSTSNGRRRSVSEEYVQQCEGTDIRDSQQDMVVDSQARKSSGKPDQQVEDYLCSQSTQSSGDCTKRTSEANLQGNADDEEMQDPVPTLYLPVEGDQTSSDLQDSTSLHSQPITQTKADNSSATQDLRTPAVRKVTGLPEDNPLVPETSPVTPLRAFNEISDQQDVSPQVDLDGIGFTQGEDDHLIFASSQPVQPSRRRVFRKGKDKKTIKASPILLEDSEGDEIIGSGIAEERSVATPPFLTNQSTSETGQSSEAILATAEHSEEIGPTKAGSSHPFKSYDINTHDEDEDVQPARLRSANKLNGPSRLLRRAAAADDTTSDTSSFGHSKECGDVRSSQSTKRNSGNTHVASNSVINNKRTSRSSMKLLPAQDTPSAKDPILSLPVSKANKSSRLSRNNSSASNAILVQPKVPPPTNADFASKPLGKPPSSRALRALAKGQNDGFSTPTPARLEAISTSKKTTRSSRRSSVNSMHGF
jgi:hypothetical protein